MSATARAALSAVVALSLAACRDVTAPTPSAPLRPHDPVVRLVADSVLLMDGCDPRGSSAPRLGTAGIRFCDVPAESAAACSCAQPATH